MPVSGIDTFGSELEDFRRALEQGSLNAIRKVLPDHAIEEACQASGHRYRKRLLTPTVTVLHMILAAIWPEESLQASWHLLWSLAASRIAEAAGRSPSSGSVANARSRLPRELWDHLFRWLSDQAQRLSSPYDGWKGHRVVLVDGTCVSMPDTPALHDAFGSSSSRASNGRFPLARLVCLSLANTMTVIAQSVTPYAAGESKTLLNLLSELRTGDLLIGDRAYAAAHFYAKYQAHGLHFLTRTHQRLKVERLSPIVRHAPNDFAADLKINPRYRRADPSLPTTVRVRFIRTEMKSRGKRRLVWFATSLLNPILYPAAEVTALYQRRWRIETLFGNFKLAGSADILRSKTVDGVHKELAARMAAINILRTIALEAAHEHGVDPVRISFLRTLRIVLAFSPTLATAPAAKLVSIYRTMLQEIASGLVPERPGRNEPRACRRAKKHYPSLKVTRQQWKLSEAA